MSIPVARGLSHSRSLGMPKVLPPLYNNDWHDFEPRIGIAWDPFKQGKTSIRAGYGIFHDRIFGQLLGLTRGNPPFQQVFFAPFFGPPPCHLPAADSNSISMFGAADFVGILPPSLSASARLGMERGFCHFLLIRTCALPMNQNWMLGVQHQLGAGLLLEINYVASKGTRLLRVIDGNAPKRALVAQLEAFCVPNNPANQGFRTPTGQCDQSTLQFGNLWFGAESGFLPFRCRQQ